MSVPRAPLRVGCISRVVKPKHKLFTSNPSNSDALVREPILRSVTTHPPKQKKLRPQFVLITYRARLPPTSQSQYSPNAGCQQARETSQSVHFRQCQCSQERRAIVENPCNHQPARQKSILLSCTRNER